jgi:hypothetical protein
MSEAADPSLKAADDAVALAALLGDMVFLLTMDPRYARDVANTTYANTDFFKDLQEANKLYFSWPTYSHDFTDPAFDFVSTFGATIFDYYNNNTTRAELLEWRQHITVNSVVKKTVVASTSGKMANFQATICNFLYHVLDGSETSPTEPLFHGLLTLFDTLVELAILIKTDRPLYAFYAMKRVRLSGERLREPVIAFCMYHKHM